MDEATMRKLLSEFKDEIKETIESTAEKLNKKIDKNTLDISSMKEEMATNNEKLENTSTRAEENSEELTDIRLRIDKLEKEKDLNNVQRTINAQKEKTRQINTDFYVVLPHLFGETKLWSRELT